MFGASASIEQAYTLEHEYRTLAISTRPPAGINYRASRSNSLGPYGNSVSSFISIHQVSAATALLLLQVLMLLYAWFMVIRQVALA